MFMISQYYVMNLHSFSVFLLLKKWDKIGVVLKKLIIFALRYEDSVSYGVAVERNRQILETDHAVEYVVIGVLFLFFQCLAAFGDAFSTWKAEGVRYFYLVFEF